MSPSYQAAHSSIPGAFAGTKSKQPRSLQLQHRLTITIVLLLGTLCSSVYAADSTADKTRDGRTGIQIPIAIGLAGVGVLLAVLAVGMLVYRRRRRRRPLQRISSMSGFAPYGMRTQRSRLPPDGLFRRAVMGQNSGTGLTSKGNGKSRRKAPPSAITVETPPPSQSTKYLNPPTQSIGLHVPPSPAYNFRGRAGIDLPVTPRTPCMGFPSPTHGDADRMV